MTHCIWKLADGYAWEFSAPDVRTDALLAQLGAIMQWRALECSPGQSARNTRQLGLIASDQPKSLEHSMPEAIRAVRCGEPTRCKFQFAGADQDFLFAQILTFTTLFGAEAQTRGGMLVHGALAVRPTCASFRAEREISNCKNEISRRRSFDFADAPLRTPPRNDKDAVGVLLTAPGGTGKTTASNRLPAPWVSLCDDTTLIVRDANGDYWAHPMPTWSRFFDNGTGGSWNTSAAVRLRAIFFLEQAAVDQATPLGAGHAAAALVQSVMQSSHLMTRKLDEPFARTLRSEWFENVSALTRRIPSFHLRLTLTGEFWKEIERVLMIEAVNVARAFPATG